MVLLSVRGIGKELLSTSLFDCCCGRKTVDWTGSLLVMVVVGARVAAAVVTSLVEFCLVSIVVVPIELQRAVKFLGATVLAAVADMAAVPTVLFLLIVGPMGETTEAATTTFVLFCCGWIDSFLVCLATRLAKRARWAAIRPEKSSCSCCC